MQLRIALCLSVTLRIYFSKAASEESPPRNPFANTDSYALPSSSDRGDDFDLGYDPFSSEMEEKYGAPGKTDDEGFNPYTDSVGPGIYGGIVARDKAGDIVIGTQYQNHNPRPGPVYAGGGYAKSILALKSPEGSLRPLLKKYPDLVNDYTTGGAAPLHMCGMSRENQDAVAVLVEFGADIEALDTYGMTPLHRMASNDLAAGAKVLLESGADPNSRGLVDQTPAQMARSAHAMEVLKVIEDTSNHVYPTNTIDTVHVVNLGTSTLNGVYERLPAYVIPLGFRKACLEQGWDTKKMWKQLNGDTNSWYKHSENPSYIYFNQGDRKWWLDDEEGNGAFVAENAPPHAPPARGWQPLSSEKVGEPLLLIFRKQPSTCVQAFSSKEQLQSAVDACLKMSPDGECSSGGRLLDHSQRERETESEEEDELLKIN